MPVSKSKQGKPLGGIGAERQSGRRHSLVLDDRLLSKQYITNKLDNRIDDTAYGVGWDGVTDRAPSVNAVYDKINSLGLTAHEWTHESTTLTDKVRSAHSGYYGIGKDIAFSDIADSLTLFGPSGASESDVAIHLAGGDANNARALWFSATAGANYIGIKGQSGKLSIATETGGTATAWSFENSRVSFGGNHPKSTDPAYVVAAPAGTAQPTLTDLTGLVQFGQVGGQGNIGFGNTSATSFIQARRTTFSPTVAAAQTLKINTLGGNVELGGSSSTITSKGNLVVDGNTVITGNLTVNGTATSLSTEAITLDDNTIVLNSNETGTPSANAGLEIERGTSLNVGLRFKEDGDVWQVNSVNVASDSDWVSIATGATAHDAVTIDNQGLGLFSLSSQVITVNDVMVKNTGDTCTGELVCSGDSGSSGTTALSVTGGNSASSNAAVSITGHLEATTKSFNIPHPLLNNKRLVYGSLEGPEHGMYQRGSFDIEDGRRIVAIDLPVYWSAMTYEDYTVNLTTYGDYNVWISNRDENGFWVETNAEKEWSFDWSVIAGRKDAKLVVEPDA